MRRQQLPFAVLMEQCKVIGHQHKLMRERCAAIASNKPVKLSRSIDWLDRLRNPRCMSRFTSTLKIASSPRAHPEAARPASNRLSATLVFTAAAACFERIEKQPLEHCLSIRSALRENGLHNLPRRPTFFALLTTAAFAQSHLRRLLVSPINLPSIMLCSEFACRPGRHDVPP